MTFDPYYKWLGIPPSEQPPHHYRLLGVQLFENDGDVIATAADRQMAHLRTFQGGPHGAESQHLLNQISTAKLCLLKAEKKAAYDAELRARLAPQASPAVAPRPASAPAGIPTAAPLSTARPLPAAPQPAYIQHPIAAAPVAPAVAAQVQPVPHSKSASNRRSKGKGKKKDANALIVMGCIGVIVLLVSIGVIARLMREPPAVAKAKPEEQTSVEAPAPANEPGVNHSPSETPPATVEAAPANGPNSPSIPLNDKPATPPVAPGTVNTNPAPTSAPANPGTVRPAPRTVVIGPPAVNPPRQIPSGGNSQPPLNSPPLDPPPGVNVPGSNPNGSPRFTIEAVGLNDVANIKRLPAPDAKAQEEARRNVRDVFKSDFTQATAPGAKLRLAQNLLRQAEETNDDPASRYMLNREALDLCVEAEDWPNALRAIGALEDSFEVDGIALKTDAVTSFSKQARSPAAKVQVANIALAVLDEAVKADLPEPAGKLMQMALAAANDSRDIELRKRTLARNGELKKQQQDFAAVQKSIETLKGQPEDPAANLQYGKYLCLAKGDWAKGLSHLAKSNDGKLAPAARLDLAEPADPGEKVTVGDAWWELADADKTPGKAALQARAGRWYQLAIADLSGLGKIKVEKRLDELHLPHDKPATGGSVASPGRMPQFLNLKMGSQSVRFRLIPAGTFSMGSPKDEFNRSSYETLHEVTLTRPFYLGTTEVPQALWQEVMGTNPSTANKNPQSPVDSVAWDDTQSFIAALNQASSGDAALRFRLPTEAEWEYACRAGTNSLYFFGADSQELSKYAWHMGNATNTTHPVGQLQPNGWGMYDMLGNVREWCQDFYSSSYYSQSPAADPPGASSGFAHTVRGQAFDSSGTDMRCAKRYSYDPQFRSRSNGLRLALEMGQMAAVAALPASGSGGPVSLGRGMTAGMIGRYKVGTQSDGIMFTYTMGKCFRQQVVEDNLTSPAMKDGMLSGSLQLAMIGILRVPQNMQVTVWIAGGSDNNGRATLYVNNNRVVQIGDLYSKNRTLQLPLNKGDHAISWQMTGGSIGNGALNFYDTATKQPLPVFYTSAMSASARQPVYTKTVDQSSDEDLPSRPIFGP